MLNKQVSTQDSYYQNLMVIAKQPTPQHAARLNSAVLHTLGFSLSGGVKKNLAKALPEGMKRDLTRGWRLIHFRNQNISAADFAKDVALHTGNTDGQYGLMATSAVFRSLKEIIDDDLAREISRDLSREVRKIWDSA